MKACQAADLSASSDFPSLTLRIVTRNFFLLKFSNNPQIHMDIHDDRTWPCPDCPKTFRRRYNLYAHRKQVRTSDISSLLIIIATFGLTFASRDNMHGVCKSNVYLIITDLLTHYCLKVTMWVGECQNILFPLQIKCLWWVIKLPLKATYFLHPWP